MKGPTRLGLSPPAPACPGAAPDPLSGGPPANSRLRPLREYQTRVPGRRPGSALHLSTLIRWSTAGVKTRDGTRVKLKAVRVGSRWFSTDEWFCEFIADLSRIPTTDEPHVVRPAVRRRAAEAAAEELDRLGL